MVSRTDAFFAEEISQKQRRDCDIELCFVTQPVILEIGGNIYLDGQTQLVDTVFHMLKH